MIDLRTPNLRSIEVGTVVISTQGFEFELLGRDQDGKETWLDRTSNLKWYDIEDEAYTYDDAMEKFHSDSRRLPTKEEFQQAEERGFRDILPNFENGWFWSASLSSFSRSYAWFFVGYYGVVNFNARSVPSIVRCVGR